MKMKKLLAGVMSAAMVATMIPASMAFSVSAAPEDSLVASYDFTQSETEGWAKYNGMNRTEGNNAIEETDEGIVFTTNDYNTYSIGNPLAGQVDGGFTVMVDVSVPSTQAQNEFEGLFGFNSHGTWDWFGVTNSGLSMNMNAVASPYTQRFFDLNVTAPVATTDMSNARYVLTVDADAITVYVNGQQIEQYTGTAGKLADDTTADVTYGEAAMALANVAQYFDLGYWRNQGDWGAFGSAMTVHGVSFYNSALSADDVASLGAYEPPVVEPDAITASVVDTTAAESYDVGDTFTVDVTAAGNVDLGGYQFTLKYDNTVLEPVLPDDSSDPDVTVSNDGENGIVALKVDLNGENTMVLGEEAITLFSLDFEVIAAPEAGSTELTLADTVFAYYDASGAVQAYDLVPTLNGCTVAIAGTVTYSPYDYNTDGNVDVNDLMALAQMIVNEDTFEDASFTYDVNEDTTVDVLDVMTLAQMIVNEEV